MRSIGVQHTESVACRGLENHYKIQCVTKRKRELADLTGHFVHTQLLSLIIQYMSTGKGSFQFLFFNLKVVEKNIIYIINS